MNLQSIFPPTVKALKSLLSDFICQDEYEKAEDCETGVPINRNPRIQIQFINSGDIVTAGTLSIALPDGPLIIENPAVLRDLGIVAAFVQLLDPDFPSTASWAAHALLAHLGNDQPLALKASPGRPVLRVSYDRPARHLKVSLDRSQISGSASQTP